jgi:hypothetical protein
VTKRRFFLKQTKGEEMAEVHVHCAFFGRVIYGPGLFFSLHIPRLSTVYVSKVSTFSTASAHRKELSSLYVNHKGKSFEFS